MSLIKETKKHCLVIFLIISPNGTMFRLKDSLPGVVEINSLLFYTICRRNWDNFQSVDSIILIYPYKEKELVDSLFKKSALTQFVHSREEENSSTYFIKLLNTTPER